MKKMSRALAVAALALATAVPAAAVSTSASAAPTVPTVADVSERPSKGIKLVKAKDGTHYGLPGNKITAKVRGKGKVKFFLGGDLVKKAKIKKGKAKYTLPIELAPGTYKVKAKYKKKKGSIKTVVWDSALNVNQAAFTISASTPSYDLPSPALTGTVKYKGKVATTGWVDMYLNGNVKGGSESTDYCCMSSVAGDGTFSFSYSFLADAQERGVGTWTYRAFYTETASFAEYIYSQPITVTVTP
jgi:hypothetical protein